jgi:Na+/proline symporter
MASSILSPLMGSLFIVALISAIMSNVNSVLLVCSGGISHDLYGRLLNPRATEREKLLVGRLSVVLLSLTPIWFVFHLHADVQAVVVVAMRLVGSFFFVPVVFGLNLRFGSSQGALWSMIGGALVCLLWSLRMQRFASIDAAEAGILASVLIYFSVGIITRPISGPTLQLFFKPDVSR